jgi:hypothetical protein
MSNSFSFLPCAAFRDGRVAATAVAAGGGDQALSA